MLEALFERGIVPDLLVGTSAGALNAAYIASRPQTVGAARDLSAVWREIRREDVFPIHPPTLIAGLTSRADHVVPDRPLRRLIARHLEFENIEDAAVELHVVAFDLLGGQEVRLSHGLAVEAVLAAASIPGILPAVRRGGGLLVDGGVANNTPISHAVELGAERIVVLPATDTSDRTLPNSPLGALDAAVHAFTLLMDVRLQSDLQCYRDDAEFIVLPATNPFRVPATDFDQAERLIGTARNGARDLLKQRSIDLERRTG